MIGVVILVAWFTFVAVTLRAMRIANRPPPPPTWHKRPPH